MDYRVCDLSGPGQRTSEPERREGRDLDEHARKHPCHRVELKIPLTAISLAWSAFASRNRGGGKSGGTRDEIGLWTADPGARSGADLRRAGQPDGRADAPLLAAGLHIGRTARPSEEGKLLCEEIVVFRDKKGRVGALDPHCAHRGTSLEWGRVEEEGLRCCYHGWLYDTQGRCIDMPCETEEFRQAMDVWQPAYPATEYGGLGFVYLLF